MASQLPQDQEARQMLWAELKDLEDNPAWRYLLQEMKDQLAFYRRSLEDLASPRKKILQAQGAVEALKKAIGAREALQKQLNIGE